jgi:hypothetical protein
MKDFYIKKKKRKFEVIINNKSNGIYSSYNQIKTAKKVANNLIGIKKNIIFHLKEKKEFGKIYGPYIGYIKDGNIKVKLYKMKGGFIGKLYNQIAPSINFIKKRKNKENEENLIALSKFEKPVKIISMNNINREEANKLVKSREEAFKKAEQNAKLATEKYEKSKIISNAKEQAAANANKPAQKAAENVKAASQAVINAEEKEKSKSKANTQAKIKELSNAKAQVNSNAAAYQQAKENSNKAAQAALKLEEPAAAEEKAAANANQAAQKAALNVNAASQAIRNAKEKARLQIQPKSNAVAEEQVTANVAQKLVLNSRNDNELVKVVTSEEISPLLKANELQVTNSKAEVEAKTLEKKKQTAIAKLQNVVNPKTSNLVTKKVNKAPERLNLGQRIITSTATRDAQVIQPPIYQKQTFINDILKQQNPKNINQQIIPNNIFQNAKLINVIAFNQTSILPRSKNPII